MHIYLREATKIFQLYSAYHMCVNAIAIVLIDSEFLSVLITLVQPVFRKGNRDHSSY